MPLLDRPWLDHQSTLTFQSPLAALLLPLPSTKIVLACQLHLSVDHLLVDVLANQPTKQLASFLTPLAIY